MYPLHVLAIAVALTATYVAAGRLAAGSRRSLVLTALATWLTATITLRMIASSDDISLMLVVWYLVLPGTSALTAATTATRLVAARGQRVSAVLLALLGWAVGILVIWFTDGRYAASEFGFWDCAAMVALPTSYASCGAVVAAGLGGRTA